MFSLPPENWYRLAGWLVLGLIIYFAYSRKHSTLAAQTAKGETRAKLEVQSAK
jgi:APA family basic amino acid/polyamine antiporter